MSTRAPLDEFVRGASSTTEQTLDELRCAETVPQRSMRPDTLPPEVVDRIVDGATEFRADPLAETIPAFGNRLVVAVTIPRESTQPLDWTSLPCAGEPLLEAVDSLSDDLEVDPQISLEPFEDEIVGARFRLDEQVHRSVMGWVWRAVDQATESGSRSEARPTAAGSGARRAGTRCPRARVGTPGARHAHRAWPSPRVVVSGLDLDQRPDTSVSA